MGKLEGKTAIVTGGAGGVGGAIVKRFLSEGATVHVADLTKERCEAACQAFGKGAIPAPVDLADASSIASMVDAVAQSSPRIDILVQCAAVVSMQPFTEITAEEFDRVIAINYRGLTLTMSAVAKRMLADGKGGSIVNFSTLNRGHPWISTYVSSKFGVEGITACAAAELAGQGIRINAISPGPIQTPLMDDLVGRFAANTPKGAEGIASGGWIPPIGRVSVPEDLVGPVMLLVSDEGSYITGHTLCVDGGISA